MCGAVELVSGSGRVGRLGREDRALRLLALGWAAVLIWKLARTGFLTKRGTDSFAPLMTGCVDHIDSLQNLLEKGAGSIHFRLAKYLCWSPLFNDDSLIGEEHLVRDLTCEGHFVSHQDGS